MREILLEVEKLPFNEVTQYYNDPLYADERRGSPEKFHNALLLHDAGYILLATNYVQPKFGEQHDMNSTTSQMLNDPHYTNEVSILRLTNAGHDFLDSIRDERVLAKVKTRLAEVGGQAALHVIKTLADQGVAEILKLGA
jgi:hypothetical protein